MEVEKDMERDRASAMRAEEACADRSSFLSGLRELRLPPLQGVNTELERVNGELNGALRMTGMSTGRMIEKDVEKDEGQGFTFALSGSLAAHVNFVGATWPTADDEKKMDVGGNPWKARYMRMMKVDAAERANMKRRVAEEAVEVRKGEEEMINWKNQDGCERGTVQQQCLQREEVEAEGAFQVTAGKLLDTVKPDEDVKKLKKSTYEMKEQLDVMKEKEEQMVKERHLQTEALEQAKEQRNKGAEEQRRRGAEERRRKLKERRSKEEEQRCRGMEEQTNRRAEEQTSRRADEQRRIMKERRSRGVMEESEGVEQRNGGANERRSGGMEVRRSTGAQVEEQRRSSLEQFIEKGSRGADGQRSRGVKGEQLKGAMEQGSSGGVEQMSRRAKRDRCKRVGDEGQRRGRVEKISGGLPEQRRRAEAHEAPTELEQERLVGILVEWQPSAALLERVTPVEKRAGQRRVGRAPKGSSLLNDSGNSPALRAKHAAVGLATKLEERAVVEGRFAPAEDGARDCEDMDEDSARRRCAPAEDRTESIEIDRNRIGTWFPETGIG